MVRRSPSINLVKSSTGSFVDRFVNWALSAGRVVVILTEIIALGAFLYRFSLDRQLIDVQSKIKQEQSVVNYLKDNEQIYRNLQNRLALSVTFSKLGKERITVLNDVVGFAPPNLSFNNITVQEDRVRIDVNASQVSALSDFTKSLRNYPKVSTIIIDKIENRPSASQINALITIVLKQ